MKGRYLTKSRFKLAMECPRKLYYTGKKEYVNKQIEDSFLQALAEGGFQVGELAKLYEAGGHNIETLDYDMALEQTNELLKKDNCIIYEAAIKYKDFFIRVDILIKEGNRLKVIEVKSKSIDQPSNEAFLTKGGKLVSTWKPYLYDIAFQNYVVEGAFPQYEIMPYLMLVDKSTLCPTDGLNQKFKISRDSSGRKYAIASRDISEEDLSVELLAKVNVEEACWMIYQDTYNYLNEELSFSALVEKLAHQYKNDLLIEPIISSTCKSCEFRASEEEMATGLKSGYHECFKAYYNWTDKDFKEATIFDLWDNRRIKSQLEQGIIKLKELDKEDLGFKSDGKPGLSRTERQWKQIEKYQEKDFSAYLDIDGLKNEMDKWTYPLHFIDFETAMPALPFNKGRRPYEGIAFQYSHHIVYEDGTIEHKGQYLNGNPGEFPNYDFLRSLKGELEKDQGSIFRYASHENTYLNMIYEQLMLDKDSVEDYEELCEFILDITKPPSSMKDTTQRPATTGKRSMVDMLEVVKRFYYDPYMKGSNSIKVVLPAVLNSSAYLQEKYSQAIYGAKDGIKSLNFEEKIWVKFRDGQVIDPYELLPDLFEEIESKNYDLINREDKISDGGAAMTAYERLQFEDMPEEVRREIEKGLLKYCELDTLAMVMIYEAWADMVEKSLALSQG